jgi:hypothetical protein
MQNTVQKAAIWRITGVVWRSLTGVIEQKKRINFIENRMNFACLWKSLPEL